MKKMMIGGVLAIAVFVALSASEIYPSSINVKDFGAVGDGIADDTAAIQKASNAAYARFAANQIGLRRRFLKGGITMHPVPEVVFPEGTYRLTGPVAFRFFVHLRGIGNAVIKQTGKNRDHHASGSGSGIPRRDLPPDRTGGIPILYSSARYRESRDQTDRKRPGFVFLLLGERTPDPQSHL